MINTKIFLETIKDVQDFVNVVKNFSFDIDLLSGRYVVDAKSIMGIFSLDLGKPINVEIHTDSCEELLAKIKKYEIQ